MANGVFDKFKKKKQFERDQKDKKKKTLLAGKRRDQERIYRALENIYQVKKSNPPEDSAVPSGVFLISDAETANDLSDLVEGDYEVLEYNPALYLERYVHPDTGKVVWDYSKRGNDQKRMIDLLDRGLVGLINCFIGEFDTKVEIDGRKVRVTGQSYQGWSLRRLD